MKRAISIDVILPLCLLICGCRSSQQNTYPGFVHVEAQTSIPYFINKDHVETDSTSSTEVVSYTIIVPQKNGRYQMLQMATNCSSALMSDGGTLYQADGQILSQIDAEKQPSSLDASSDIGKVAMSACRVAMNKRAFSGGFAIQRAFVALFGNYDSSTESSSVPVKSDGGTENGKLTLLLDSQFSEGNITKHLIVTSTSIASEACHACGARIGAYVFANRDGHWIPEIMDKEALQFGAWGGAGTVQAVRFAPEAYGFSLTLEDMHQGTGDTTEQLVAPVGSHYQPVLTLNTEEDNSGQCGPPEFPACYKNASTVRFLDSTHGLFDIEVDESGTADTDQGIVPADSQRRYVFDGNKYVEQISSPESTQSGAS